MFFVLFLVFSASIIQAQNINKDTINDNPYVRWVSQYPSSEKDNNKRSVLGRISDFVFGEKQVPVLLKPMSVLAVNPDTFIVLDQGNGFIFQIQNNECEIPKYLKKKTDNFSSLVGICSKPNNEKLFTDSRLNKILSIDADKKGYKVLNDSLKLQQPTGIAYNTISKEIWVVETGAHRIAILDENGNLIKTLGGRGTSPGEFNFPTNIWIDKSGDAFVVDAMNFRVQIFNKKGEFVSKFGEVGDATGYFARPKGIATDSYGNIYIVDALFNTVQIFDTAGNFLYQFGKQGREKEDFWMPSGIYIDNKNYIYVADSYNARVQIFQLINGKENGIEKKYKH